LRAGAPAIELQRDEQLVVLGDIGGRLDQLDIGGHWPRVQRQARVARLLQIGGDVVAVVGHRSLHPPDPADHAVIACQTGEQRSIGR